MQNAAKHIYMVDDDLAMCELVKFIVTREGFTISSQHRVYQAYEKIKEAKPDIILLDLHLPDGNGLNVCKKVRNDDDLAHIPIIILSTREFYIERDVAFEAGADLFMAKPFDQKELIKAINEYLSEKISIKFWGVRGSTPTPEASKMNYGGNTPCVQLDIPGVNELVILDAGTGIRNLGDHLAKQEGPIKGYLFITHPHWDHIQGMPFFKSIYAKENSFMISMPEQLEGNCKEVLSGQMQYTYFPVTPKMLMADISFTDQPPIETHYDGFSVEFILANHPTNTAIYKIRTHGKIIIYAPDNELIPHQDAQDNTFVEHLIDFCQDADVLIHDAQYCYDNYDKFRSWGHSPWQEALKVAEAARVDHLILFSHDPLSTDEYLDELDKEIQTKKEHVQKISLAKELSVIQLKI